jgi:16S rRNA (adenine1518-N6/adenine1519-N6)-dimethyltransferase
LKKRWGQNFLLDIHYRRRVVSAAGIERSDRVWEIGPGLGSLSEFLLQEAGEVVLFEVDWGLVRHLRRYFGASLPYRVVAGDFRKTWREERELNGPPDVIVGNLPYRLAATMIGDLLEAAVACRAMVFTVQKEVARRMIAAPGTADYSSFSVLVQAGSHPRICFDIPRGAFLPVPEVDSSVVELLPRADIDREGMEELARIVRTCFASRRKTLGKNLSAVEDPDRYRAAFARLGIDLGLRAERVSPEQYLAVARQMRS